MHKTIFTDSRDETRLSAAVKGLIALVPPSLERIL